MLEKNCQFEVVYQPLVCLVTGKIEGFEALVRWHHPTKGLISPGLFIPIAEDTGLIVPLGNWILKTAITQMKLWQQKYHTQLRDAKIAINISGKQLLQTDLLQQIERILEETEFDPKFLKLEITETILIENFNRAIYILEQLSELGVELSLDDFGTGYSSLGRLQTLPIKTLKIDRCFVIEMDRSLTKLRVVKAIANLANSLKLKVIVEGIETTNQLTIIKNLNCHQGQGYYFAEPLSVSSIEALLKNPFPWQNHFFDIIY